MAILAGVLPQSTQRKQGNIITNSVNSCLISTLLVSIFFTMLNALSQCCYKRLKAFEPVVTEDGQVGSIDDAIAGRCRGDIGQKFICEPKLSLDCII